MIKDINFPINELLQKCSSNNTSLDYLNWWLLKYDDLYKKCKSNYAQLCNICEDLKSQGLPYNCLSNPKYCSKNSEINQFIKIHEDLERIIDYSKLEQYCTIALQGYNNSYEFDWILKHYDFWQSRVFIFCVEYLDNDAPNIEYHMGTNNDLKIIIDRSNYKNIEVFSSLCNELFYNKELLPDKLKEITDEIEKLPYKEI